MKIGYWIITVHKSVAVKFIYLELTFSIKRTHSKDLEISSHTSLLKMVIRNIIYQVLQQAEDILGARKRLQPQTDIVVILGGTSTLFGQRLCQLLVHKFKTTLVNVDRHDDPSLHNGGPYYFFQCDFSKRESVNGALKSLKRKGLRYTVLINNLNEYMDSAEGNDTFQYCTSVFNAHLINVMIFTRMFVTQLVRPVDDIYIINITRYQDTKIGGPKYATYHQLAQAGLIQYHDGLSSELQLKEINNGNDYKSLLVHIPMDNNRREEEYACQVLEMLQEGRKGVQYIGANSFGIIMPYYWINCVRDFYTLCRSE